MCSSDLRRVTFEHQKLHNGYIAILDKGSLKINKYAYIDFFRDAILINIDGEVRVFKRTGRHTSSKEYAGQGEYLTRGGNEYRIYYINMGDYAIIYLNQDINIYKKTYWYTFILKRKITKRGEYKEKYFN